MLVNQHKCVGCNICTEICPLKAISLVEDRANISESCVDCGTCLKVCPKGALVQGDQVSDRAIQCPCCPISCRIKPGKVGACQRFINENGILIRNVPLQRYEDVQTIVGKDFDQSIRRPLTTAIGSGTTYPDYKPSPHIVQSKVDDVDVVTVVTEAPLSYSGIKVKIDTDAHIGEEGAPIFHDQKKVGHVTTEEYGSKMLSMGGVNLLTGRDGVVVARLIVDIANRKPFSLEVENGPSLELQVGEMPRIDGRVIEKMRVGCGSATMGLFAPYFLEAADEVIVLDCHLIGLFTEHAAGKYLGARYSGVELKARKSTPGRYFGEKGSGWGGTPFEDPLDIVASVNLSLAPPGMELLITETTGERAAMYKMDKSGKFHRIDITLKGRKAVEMILRNSEPSRVSAVFVGGTGGSARAGVTKYPIKLNKAIRQSRAKLTVGGAPTFILPGGGINFMVDVEKVMTRAFTWVPTPAPVVPIEYTLGLEDYVEIGGHIENIKPLDELLLTIQPKLGR